MPKQNQPWTLDELNTVLDAARIIVDRLKNHRDAQNVAIWNTFISDYTNLWVITLEKEIRAEEKAAKAKSLKSTTPKLMVSPEQVAAKNESPEPNGKPQQ